MTKLLLMLMVAGVWSGRGDSPTALKDIYGCEEFEKDELIEMEAIIYQQRERALEDTYDKYAKASTAEEANSLYSRGVCLDAILTDRFGPHSRPSVWTDRFDPTSTD